MKSWINSLIICSSSELSGATISPVQEVRNRHTWWEELRSLLETRQNIIAHLHPSGTEQRLPKRKQEIKIICYKLIYNLTLRCVKDKLWVDWEHWERWEPLVSPQSEPTEKKKVKKCQTKEESPSWFSPEPVRFRRLSTLSANRHIRFSL